MKISTLLLGAIHAQAKGKAISTILTIFATLPAILCVQTTV